MRQEVIGFQLKADLLRTEADINCMSGLMECETQGMTVTSKHKEVLQKAEEKQREAMMKDRQAEKNKELLTTGRGKCKKCMTVSWERQVR